jgi:uncharacterized protein (TIGR01777 family)
MKIVIAGGRGFLGTALGVSLTRDGHEVVVLTRGSGPAPAAGLRHVRWAPEGGSGSWTAELNGSLAVVNLAGESIAAGRWSPARKRLITDSRVAATRRLVEAIGGLTSPPQVFVSGSAVGYYGPRGDEEITETSPPGTDFLAGVCTKWETEAARAASSAVRVVVLRTGLVLARNDGALPRMLPPFWIGAGGPLGSGRQYWPWIHIEDWVNLVRWAITSPALSGPLNVTAPHPVTNAEFARHLGRAMHRPALLPAPAFALKLLLGEMAEGLLLSGQRAVPARALETEFVFRYPQLGSALSSLFGATTRNN